MLTSWSYQPSNSVLHRHTECIQSFLSPSGRVSGPLPSSRVAGMFASFPTLRILRSRTSNRHGEYIIQWVVVSIEQSTISIDDMVCRGRPVFRVSPNELSFASVGSWKEIYGHRHSGQRPLVKSKFYEIYGAGFDSLCIGSERNPDKHTRMKKSLSPAFSLR
ncbi:hypothetical protein N7481_010853 [Penicillium waksmanii]|uniref:uncharacterized protein n=1 Tax=Penicillium waksmanii TaxID=69791 RepID=UPI0025496BF4|nr:uncharacterized protein N7481_010853 [Penicillium waksmanii]KAJ5973643.1 hypothetical protein N7481_010853 [Penicillium waksmanii]